MSDDKLIEELEENSRKCDRARYEGNREYFEHSSVLYNAAQALGKAIVALRERELYRECLIPELYMSIDSLIVENPSEDDIDNAVEAMTKAREALRERGNSTQGTPTYEELKPCPFCGDTELEGGRPFPIDAEADYHAIRCGNPCCGAEIVMPDVELLINLWNRRVTFDQEQRIQELESAIENAIDDLDDCGCPDTATRLENTLLNRQQEGAV